MTMTMPTEAVDPTDAPLTVMSDAAAALREAGREDLAERMGPALASIRNDQGEVLIPTVYEICEHDWVAAFSEQEAINFAQDFFGYDVEEECGRPEELVRPMSFSDLIRLDYVPEGAEWDEEARQFAEEDKISMAERLVQMIMEGEKFPAYFASRDF